MDSIKSSIQKFKMTKEYQEFKRFFLGYLWGVIILRIKNLIYKDKGGIVDVPDNRDITPDEIVMGEAPKRVNIHRLSKIQDQRKSPILPGASCGPHSVSHGMESNGYINPLTGPDVSYKMKAAGLLHSWGSYLIDNPKFALKEGWITGFFRVSTVEQMKAHLATGQAILVGSDKLHFNWEPKTQRYEYKRSNRSGHLWCMLPKYNEEGVWCADSLVLYGEEKFLYWKDIGFLFPSRIAITTDKKFATIQNIKKDTLKLIEEVNKSEKFIKLPEPARMMRVQQVLNKKYKDKKLVQVGFRLATGQNIESYMLK